MQLLRILAGILLGYGLSLFTSLGWFLWTNHTPTDPATASYILAIAVVGVLFAVLGGYVAAVIAGTPVASYTVAALILLLSLLAIVETRSVAAGHGTLWSLYVSILLIAPAAASGGLIYGQRTWRSPNAISARALNSASRSAIQSRGEEIMDGIEIPAELVVPIDSIAPGLHGLRIAFVNVFGVSHPDGSWTLIDAAIPLSAPLIRSWAEKTFGKPPTAIVLTHGHFDHVSAARSLADGWNIPVYAHTHEFPYLTGKESYPPPDTGAGGGLMPLLAPLFPRSPIDIGDRLRPLPHAGTEVPATGLMGDMGGLLEVPELPGWQVLNTPGHTPGHVSFFRTSDRTLIVGDAFCSTKPESFFESNIVQQPELHGPPGYFTSDWNAARHSVQQLANLDPLTVALGHGKPLSGDMVAPSLRRLASNFDTAGKPANRQS